MERPYGPLIVESRQRKLLRTITRIIVYPLLFVVFIPLFRLKVDGRKRLKGPAISVMNHCIYVEWFFLWHAVRPGYIRFTAEQANMQRRDLGWFNFLLGVLGIPDDNTMALAPAVTSALGRKELIHFFPEGVLHTKNQDPGKFMIGAAWFACRHDVPLIPVAELLTRRKIQRFLPWWPPAVRLVVGNALYPAEYRQKGDRLRDTAQRLTEEAERFVHNTIKNHKAQSAPR